MTNQLIYVDDTTDGICGNAGVTVDNGSLINFNDFGCENSFYIGNNGTYIRENGNILIKGTTRLQDDTHITGTTYLSKAMGRPISGWSPINGAYAVPTGKSYFSSGTNGHGTLALRLKDSIPGDDIYIQCNNIDTYDMFVTPDNFYDGTSVKFTAKDQYAHFIWTHDHWKVFANTGTVIP